MSTQDTKACSHITISNLSPDELVEPSTQRCLALSLEEMQVVQKQFSAQGKEPTDVELECIAQTWSEHCKHKIFQATINYEDNEGKKTLNSLYSSFIKQATKDVRAALGDDDFCVSVFKDNAGVIKYTGKWCVAFKVETHNHPSALDPYGGSATGIGGVIRDILGTGLGAKPFANTDIFCVAPSDTSFDDLPDGTLHPRRILKGVVEGVRDYGNRMGIATINGSVNYSPKYLGNPLVFCGTVGLIPEERVEKACSPGDMLISIGGRTGRDGLHGATFSSLDLHADSAEASGGAVQIGNPIVEKRCEEAVLRIRDEGLFTDVTDCGAGGFSSAVGEIAKENGCVVYLDNAPLKYSGLEAWEIFLSEAQERMVVAIKPESFDRVKEICRQEAVECSLIAEITDTHRLEVCFKDEVVCDMSMEFLHEGVPKKTLNAHFEQPVFEEPTIPAEGDELTDCLLGVLKTWDVCSKEWIIRQYDHEVQGGSVTKPLQGQGEGPGDAAIWNPLPEQNKSVIVSHGINVRYGDIDPYHMVTASIDEALRGIVAAGGTLDRVGILDNFCMGNPENPQILGALVRMATACYDMATACKTPFISGKDSFYNQFKRKGETIAIPPTLLVSAVGIMDDLQYAQTSDFKDTGNSIYVLGTTRKELGGSSYHQSLGAVGNDVPKTDPERNLKVMNALAAANRKGLVRAIHDLSDGGLGVALAEMAFCGRRGCEVDLSKVVVEGQLSAANILFSESTGRFVVEVPQDKEAAFEAAFEGLAAAKIGSVNDGTQVIVCNSDGSKVVDVSVDDLQAAWRAPYKGW